MRLRAPETKMSNFCIRGNSCASIALIAILEAIARLNKPRKRNTAGHVLFKLGWLSESERAHLAILGGEDDWDSAQLCKTDAGNMANVQSMLAWSQAIISSTAMQSAFVFTLS